VQDQLASDFIIELKDITKTFPGVVALSNASLRVRKGTVHALVGENGAGKSTMMKIINGMYKADCGEIFFKGQKINPQNPKHMLHLGIATIHQELSPILEMTIAENIYLGREPKTKTGNVDYKRMYSETQSLMDDFKLPYNPHSKMKTLSISDIQLVEIVKATSRNASLVIMDEPTSSITESETRILFSHVRRLKDQGISIIYISHKMDEIFEICDDITIYRDGQWVKSSRLDAIDRKTIIELMVGRELSEVYPKTEAVIGQTVLEVRNMTKQNKFQNISFSIKAGEIVGFAGLVGAGRTELFKAIFGMDLPDCGEIFVNNSPAKIHNITDAIQHGIIMTPEDRKHEGLILCRSIMENISLTTLKTIIRHHMIDSRLELVQAKDMVNKMSIKISSLNAACSTLSGGNQQKVVLAKWLLHSPTVLILDEPTRGIDVGAKYEIYKLMCELAKSGVAIVMISSELPELIGMCDRIVVMSSGKHTGEIERQDFSQESIMTLAMKGFENEYN
jgi:ABC-type sugar transport system ATPase subunit